MATDSKSGSGTARSNHGDDCRSIAIVGAGPSGISFLERLAANAPELIGGQRLVVHLIDPYPAGAGRVWRSDQSSLLWMNSMTRDVTMYTDDTVTCEGPVLPGPTLLEWAQGADSDTVDDSDLARELKAIEGSTFPTRRVQSAYLAAVFAEVVARLPASVELVTHHDRVTDLVDCADGTQELVLAWGRRLRVDMVVLTLGHLDVAPDRAERRLENHSRRHGSAYLAPDFQADCDLTEFRPGSRVLLRGMGLACIDAVVLLTEGRGGHYEEADRGLVYHPSGLEPLLVTGSRRGVPYHAKITYQLQGPRPQLPRFMTTEAVRSLVASLDRLDFRAHVWPLLAKELAWAHYHELFHAHPERTALPWEQFEEALVAVDGDSPGLAALVESAVPSAEDHLEFTSFDRPLDGLRFPDDGSLQEHVRAYIEADLRRRADPGHSADLGTFNALLVVYGQISRILDSGKLDLRSRRDDVDGWWRSYFNFFASGPPERRLREWLALSRAGVLEFVGAGMWVEPADGGGFRSGGSNTDRIIEADGLIEARNPGPSVRRSREELVRRLFTRQEIAEEVLEDPVTGFRYETGRIVVTARELRLVSPAGLPHPRRVALGFPTSRPAAGTFSRPRTNAAAFRQNDAVARSVLATLSEIPSTAPRLATSTAP